MLDIVVIWLCKVIYWFLRKTGRHGAALPGLVAERLRPGILKKLTSLPEGIVIISGTNGKTTTTHFIAQALRRSGKRVFTNHSGSNMTRGILASIVRYSTWSGKLPYDVAVLEIDEAYAAKLGPILKPRGVVVTNVLRDQLDRFGEIDYTAELLFKLADSATELVVFNANDSRLAKLASKRLKAKTASFGYDKTLKEHFVDDDSLYGKDKGTWLAADVMLKSFNNGQVEIYQGGHLLTIQSPTMSGWHNAINLTATFALLSRLFGITKPEEFESLEPPYGRGEVIEVGGCMLTLQLVKNPVGFRTAMDVGINQAALIVINDDIADGRDVSWLWDVDVAPLASRPTIICSGSRAYDMTVRLKYNDINVANTTPNILSSLEDFTRSNREGVVFLTYTAMLKTRTILNNLQDSRKVASI